MYSTYFRPVYAHSLNPPTDVFLNALNSPRPGIGQGWSPDPSSCEFWCSSRLNKSDLNRDSSLPARISRPWIPILGKENRICDTDSGPPRLDSSQINDRHSQANGTHQEAFNQFSHADIRPSDYLIDTIQNVVLLSPNTDRRNWTLSEKSQQPLRSPLSLKQKKSSERAFRGSLQVITAKYIQRVDRNLRKPVPELENALQCLLHDDSFRHLTLRQYEITDVMAWAWIIMSSTTYDAALRLVLLEADQAANPVSHRRVPTFIPLMLLKQKVDLKTFRLLLVYSLHSIIGRPIPPLDLSFDTASDAQISQFFLSDQHTSDALSLDPSTCTTLVARLLSHARRLWPEAQLSIAQAFAFYSRRVESELRGFLTKELNEYLFLLSSPPALRPFASASVRQQAQFELLKAMAKHDPALPVTRLGYQGLTSVQLAHKKTAAERESAELKAPSWPPWREERSGIDSTKGVQGTKSRAMRVMSQMREAGYPHSLWEDVASVLAGWDTDNSPTIQTRALARSPKQLRGKRGRSHHLPIWTARIHSTRTVREAWACFMAYESQGLPPSAAVYVAMAKKLLYGRNFEKKPFHGASSALPGDGPEVSPEPASARDWIYTPSEPPKLNDFLKKMLAQGVRPTGRFLAMLLHGAPSFRAGLDYLRCSDLTNQQLRVLLSFGEHIPDSDINAQRALNELPEYLVSAFVRFVCRFSVVDFRGTSKNERFGIPNAFPIIMDNWKEPLYPVPTLLAYTDRARKPAKAKYSELLFHAIGLLRRRNSQSPQEWLQLLSGLCSARVFGIPGISYHTQMILAWHEIIEVLKWLEERNIEMDSDGFQIICRSFSSAVAAGLRDQASMERSLKILATAAQSRNGHPDLIPRSFENMVNTGLTTLKRQFDQLVYLDPKTSSVFDSLKLSLEQQTEEQVTVPALPHVPSPADLHAFVRSLGLAKDSDGLLGLLRWMSRHALTLKQTSDEYANGDVIMRRTIIAIRLFLEGQPGKGSHRPDFADEITPDESDVQTFVDPTLQEAYDLVTATEVWGPWPSNEEVWKYLSHGQKGHLSFDERIYS